jgi:hypothetical protein
MDVHQVRRRHEDSLLSMPTVTGVGTSKDESGNDVIVVYVTHRMPDGDPVPHELDGVPVRVVEMGFPTAQ